MRTALFDEKELRSISPDILAAYAAAAGWKIVGEYGSHCDLYGAADKPEIIIPRTNQLVDYASGVAELIQYFTAVAEKDAQSVFLDLTYARCDVIRARVESESDSAPIIDAVGLMNGSKNLLTATLRSLDNPKPTYHGPIGKYASVLNNIRFGQTEKGSLVMTMLTSDIEPASQEQGELIKTQKYPTERRMTRRLMEALDAARAAVDQTAEGERGAFERAIKKGVSSNLCKALVKMAKPFPSLRIETTWAKTLPMKTDFSEAHFFKGDVGILKEAAAELKQQKEMPDKILTGIVERLHRPENKKKGTITLKTTLEGEIRRVSAVLEEGDYAKAIQAHDKEAQITLSGILEQTDGKRKLQSARFVGTQQHEQGELFKE